MVSVERLIVRRATADDQSCLVHLSEHAERVHIPRGGFSALNVHSVLLAEYEAQVVGFISVTVRRPPVGILQAIALADEWPAMTILDALLPSCFNALRRQGVEAVAYIGDEFWLSRLLVKNSFTIVNRILTYAKEDGRIPDRGNQMVHVRPAEKADLAAVVALDEVTFDPLWRNTPDILAEIWARSPYFTVAELDGRIVGYQFNDVDGEHGHLTRIAVHPDFQGQGIGVRLMAEAIDFFRAAGVRVITLNTQKDNSNAQRLYRWFGFRRLEGEALVLWKSL
ncbi:MAG: GNAT family N-acetyltransferase [Anaerolineae bacterium]|jgi:ribosomal protein S18 acetylase RimI-like enzyme|nr:GNAT family N-acetyltransferase [Anaerolineae bacterium]MDH7473744.1 GNAT family N-acetyltransferase [Anaerolineae bacterium]